MKQLSKLKWLLLVVLMMTVGCATSQPTWAAANAALAPNPKFMALDANGDPYVGGKLYTYEPYTTTPKTTWTTYAKTTPNTNPIILDSRGQANVWIDSTNGKYRFKLTNSSDVLIWTCDNIYATPVGAIIGDNIDGRALRAIYFQVSDGTNPATVRLELYSRFNGDTLAAVDNIAKGSSSTYFSLDVSGSVIQIKAAALTGNCIGIVSSSLQKNASLSHLTPYARSTGQHIEVRAYSAPNGISVDFTGLVDQGAIHYLIGYITDE